MAKAGSKSESPRIALDQIQEVVATSGRRGDALRAEGLAGLALVKRTKLVQTRRERARVAVRHGENSAQVARLDRQMAIEHSFLVNSRAEADRLQTPILARDDKTWQVHGYLRSQDGLARVKYTVGVFPAEDGRKAPLVSTETDGRGYFHMRLTPSDDGKDSPGPRQGDADAADEQAKDAERERAAIRIVRALRQPVVLGTTVPGQTGVVIDDRPLHPQAGAIAYRDITVANPQDNGNGCQLRTRLLGNSGSRELHDLDNEKRNCQIAEIRPDRRFYFQSEAQAQKLGYDYCAHCFGKRRSKR